MTLLQWASLASVCLLGAMSPGPSLAVVVRNTMAGGSACGLVAAVAHGLGVSLYAILVVSGLAVMITRSPGLFIGLQWGGAIFLAWLGIQALRSGSAVSLEDPTTPASVSIRKAANQGFSVAFLNPKLAVFFLALFSQFLDAGSTLLVKAIMVTTVGAIDAGWYALLSLLLGRAGIVAALRRHQGAIDCLFGVILLLLAITIVLRS